MNIFYLKYFFTLFKWPNIFIPYVYFSIVENLINANFKDNI